MYKTITLKYSLNEFEPYISEKTMDIHYNRLYKNYLNRLNVLLTKNNFDFSYPVYELFSNISSFPIGDRSSIAYNAGGVINHEMYFNMLNKNTSGIPEPLNSALIKQFGSINNFILELIRKASTLPGSGYTFLAVNPLKELLLVNVANQDNPYFYNLIPIMNIDVWEHAYYLDHYNNRDEYIEAFLRFLDFNEINKNYVNAIKKLS